MPTVYLDEGAYQILAKIKETIQLDYEDATISSAVRYLKNNADRT